jgi:hypothetical protein
MFPTTYLIGRQNGRFPIAASPKHITRPITQWRIVEIISSATWHHGIVGKIRIGTVGTY